VIDFSWICTSANGQSRSICGAYARLAQRGKAGGRFCTIMGERSGPVTRLQVTDLFFRSLFAFFIIELRSRKVVHAGVTRSPTDAWTAEPLREATPYGHTPKYLIRDHDSKFGPCFARVAATSSMKILKTPYHAKRPNAICERFLGECSAGVPGSRTDPQ